VNGTALLTFTDDHEHVFFDAGKSAFKGDHIAEGGELNVSMTLWQIVLLDSRSIL
jgi:hypothetical protein